MKRYRAESQLDDPSLLQGDGSFVGINEYDAPENLQPGQVQAAVNMDFTTQDAVTRGGFVCLPALGTTPQTYNWTSRTSAANYLWDSVAYGNGIFVAVGASGGAGRVMTSTDGITWTIQSCPATNVLWASVTFGKNTFVAVASNASATSEVVMTSSDGITWTARTGASTNQWFSVTYGNGLFVAVAKSGTGDRVMTSPDGITWTARTSAADNDWQAVCYGNGLFVAVSNSGTSRIMTSPDGINWTNRTTPLAYALAWRAIVYGNSKYVAVGAASVVLYSSDGVTWSVANAAADLFWEGIVYASDKFVAIARTGTGNRVMYSNNGTTWVSGVSAVDNGWLGITAGNDLLVAVSGDGTGNRVMTAYTKIYASNVYSDPNDAASQWMMLVGANEVGFYAFGRQSRSVTLGGYTVSAQSTIVQCNNQVYIFRGADSVPLYWTGDWSTTFTLAPTTTPATGFSIIPNSNQATYYQNRLWIIDGKDTIAASDILDFTAYDDIANSFNVNTGSSDYLVATYPFGENSLVVFKNRSILLLQNVQGSLNDVTVTEITRQVGLIGINAVVSVGSDLVYMSDRNINLLTQTATNNAVQHKTLPLSRNIRKIFSRVNWQQASKVSMAYNDNKLYVALPLDNSTVCNSVVVYNFVTENWYGEWNFNDSLGMAIQGWAIASYLGLQRLHAITEDGRIFVTEEGQNDISGTTVAEISASLTTRAYSFDQQNTYQRRLWLDMATNRPSFSVTSYSEGVSESSSILTAQTYSRTESWLFNDSTYTATNANDDYNRAYRKDYSTGPNSIQCGTGFMPEMEQEYRFPIITRRQGRLAWLKVSNTQGLMRIMSAAFENRPGMSNNLVQV